MQKFTSLSWRLLSSKDMPYQEYCNPMHSMHDNTSSSVISLCTKYEPYILNSLNSNQFPLQSASCAFQKFPACPSESGNLTEVETLNLFLYNYIFYIHTMLCVNALWCLCHQAIWWWNLTLHSATEEKFSNTIQQNP